MEDLLGEIELRVKLEEKKKELLQKLRQKEIQQVQEEQNYLNETPSNANNNSIGRRSDPDPEKIKQRMESIKRKAWCLGETLHMDEGNAHRQKKRKFHSIPLVTPNDSSHASITLSDDENVVQVIVKRAQPDSRRGSPIEMDNKGHQLLKRIGWRENSGLGRKENGMIEPLIPIVQNNQKGLGSKTKQDTQVHNFCEVCNKIIPEASWASHLNGKKHKHRVHYVQMLEQLAPHLLPEERHQLLDEDEESKDDENSTIELVQNNHNANNNTSVNNSTYNNNNNVNKNNEQKLVVEKSDARQTVTSTSSTSTTNNTSQPKLIGPVHIPVPVNTTASATSKTSQPTAAQSTQVTSKPQLETKIQIDAKSDQTKGEVKAPLLAPVPLPPDGNHQWLLCDVCKIHMYPQNWDMHINGKVHQKNLKKLVAEKQIEEEMAKAQLLSKTIDLTVEQATAGNTSNNRRPIRSQSRGSFRGRRNNSRYNAGQYQQHQYGEEQHYGDQQSYQNTPLYAPPVPHPPIIAQQLLPQVFLPSQMTPPDPRFFSPPMPLSNNVPPLVYNSQMPIAPPGTTAVVSMIRDIIAQRIGTLQQQQNEPKGPDPSRIFEY